ncbi:MAG: hypothetical protein R8F63_07965 [Acidimicrobiales bacterium]|nr:hypothetical protein [Acidimicrobiales bacterium]
MSPTVRRLLAVSLAVALLVVGCSLPTDESAQVIAQDRLDESLRRVTTTTTTTVPPVRTRDFAYFLLTTPEDNDVIRKVRQVPVPVALGTPLFDLIDPMGAEDFAASLNTDEGLINQVREYDVIDITIDDSRGGGVGVATVFLETIGEDPPNAVVLRDVAAQLVWTLTGEPDIGQILISIDGELQELPTTNDDQNLTSEPVDTDDYADYNPELVDDPPDDTTTTTTSTTVPPDE